MKIRQQMAFVGKRQGPGDEGSNPTETLGVYSHLFGNPDEQVAVAVEDALADALAG